MDANIPREEKLKHTEAWWLGDMQAFSSAGYSRRDFAKMTKESKLLFRRGTQDLLRLCKKLDIPLVIVSGGIHELIEESLRLLEEQPLRRSHGNKLDLRSITILSNQFEYDESVDRVVKGYKLPFITSANK